MRVLAATDGMRLERDHLYVIPPGTYLSVEHGALRLSAPTAPRGLRLPFDFLLNSLAAEYGERAVCVVLSGTGTDGSLGLVAIKEHGGLVIAQDPEEAEYDGMLRSAIATGAVDLVLPAADIADALSTHPHGSTAPRSRGEAAVADQGAAILRRDHRTPAHHHPPRLHAVQAGNAATADRASHGDGGGPRPGPLPRSSAR